MAHKAQTARLVMVTKSSKMEPVSPVLPANSTIMELVQVSLLFTQPAMPLVRPAIRQPHAPAVMATILTSTLKLKPVSRPVHPALMRILLISA